MDFNYILNQPAFVIHINEISPERKPFFESNITNAGFKNMIIFEGINLSKKDVLQNCLEEFKIKLHKDLNNGQKGCLFSHLKLLTYIIKNKILVSTIFEDDVHFHPEWHNLASHYFKNTPNNFDIIFIGNQIDECKTSNNIPIINNCSTFCTHAYIITLEGAKKLLQYLLYWDYYKKECEEYVGHPLTGLFCIDIMIKNIQDRMNKNKLKKTIH